MGPVQRLPMCRPSAADEAEVGGGGDGGGAGVDAELGVDVGQVGLDGGLGEAEPVADALVGQAVGDQTEDFRLAAGQGGTGVRRRFMSRSATVGARVVRPAAAVRTAAASSSGGASLRR